MVVDDTLVQLTEHPNAVKVTPCHDFDDYACGKRHGLKEKVILTPEGRMNTSCGRYAGLDRFEARRRVVEELKEKGLYA